MVKSCVCRVELAQCFLTFLKVFCVCSLLGGTINVLLFWPSD